MAEMVNKTKNILMIRFLVTGPESYVHEAVNIGKVAVLGIKWHDG